MGCKEYAIVRHLVEQQRLTHVGGGMPWRCCFTIPLLGRFLPATREAAATPCVSLPAAPPSILPQVLYGPYVHGPPHLQQCAAPPYPHHAPQQQQQQQQQQDAPMGMDCGWQAAASPRAPLAAVNGWQHGGGMMWEGAVAGASRKRGHEAAMGEHASSGPGERGGVGKRMPWSMLVGRLMHSVVRVGCGSTCLQPPSTDSSQQLQQLTAACRPLPALLQTRRSSGGHSATASAERISLQQLGAATAQLGAAIPLNELRVCCLSASACVPSAATQPAGLSLQTTANM